MLKRSAESQTSGLIANRFWLSTLDFPGLSSPDSPPAILLLLAGNGSFPAPTTPQTLFFKDFDP
jgi:hypothetical protein